MHLRRRSDQSRTDVSSTVAAPGNISVRQDEPGGLREGTVGPEIDLAVVGEATIVLLERVC